MKNMILKLKNYYMEKSLNKKTGTYSVNKTVLSFIASVFIFSLFCAQPLNVIISQIKNNYVKNICFQLIKPIEDFSIYLGIYNLFPSARNSVLTFTGLNGKLEWENFYYTEDKPNTAAEKNDLIDTEPETVNRLSLLPLKEITGLKAEQEKIIFSEENLLVENTKEVKEKTDLSDAENYGMQAEEKSEIIFEESSEIPLYDYTAEKPFRILMFGDSQMKSLAGGLQRLTVSQKAIEITEISVHSSGFVRGDYYNWKKKLESVFAQTKDKPYDAAAFLLGMNDYQNFYNSDGKVLIKETSAWEEKYEEKIHAILDIVLANSRKAYWFGMPAVRRKSFNEDLSYIEKVQKKAASNYGNQNLIKVSIRDIAPGKDVPYTDNLQTLNGKYIKLMRDDGIHYTIAGGEYIMQSFLNTLYTDWNIEKNDIDNE